MSTKIAIVSDVHADFPMLQAALARARDMGVDQVVCAGDVVDGDVFPDETIALLASEGVLTIRGNHDRWALEHARELRRSLTEPEPEAGGTLGGGGELSRASLRWLARLPTSLRLDVEGVRVAVHHARPGIWGSDMVGVDPSKTSPAEFKRLLNNADSDILVVGHTHERWARYVGSRGLVANPGALWAGGTNYQMRGAAYVPGEPSHGTFAVLELPALRFTVYRASDGAAVLESAPPAG